jgi:hypothetical protein
MAGSPRRRKLTLEEFNVYVKTGVTPIPNQADYRLARIMLSS